jgi:cytochrome P450
VEDQCDWLFGQSEILQFAGVAKMSSFLQLPYFIPSPGNRRIAAATQPFDDAVREALARWRGPEPPGQSDLVGELLTARDDQGVALTDHEIRDEAVTMIFGGKETAGFSLVWTAYLLALYPEVQEKAIAEVREVLGGREPTAADVNRLPYLDLVCKEAMRLYPPAYMMCRQVIRNTHVGPYRIRRGNFVLILTYHIHRDPRWFDDPEAFRPEPFGGGRRVCVGGRLAMLESILSLASILQRCRMKLPEDHVPPKLGTDVALHPKGPIDVILEPLEG